MALFQQAYFLSLCVVMVWSLNIPPIPWAEDMYIIPRDKVHTSPPLEAYILFLQVMPTTVDLARDWGWTVSDICVAGKGRIGISNDTNYPMIALYDSNGILVGQQGLIQGSTCCDFSTPSSCQCESNNRVFPTQRYVVDQPFISCDNSICPNCFPTCLFQTNDVTVAYPGYEDQDHHTWFNFWRDPDRFCDPFNDEFEFYMDRVLHGYKAPNTSPEVVNGYNWQPTRLNVALPYGWLDTMNCVDAMGIHVAQLIPYPMFGPSQVSVLYSSGDESKLVYGWDTVLTGGQQPQDQYPIPGLPIGYYENFETFVGWPMPSATKHMYFTPKEQVFALCPRWPAYQGYRPIDGIGNNIRNPVWGGVEDIYTRKFDDFVSEKQGSPMTHYAHWVRDWPYLDLCNQISQFLGMGNYEGGGNRAFPGVFTMWTFGDPAYFCSKLLQGIIPDSELSTAPILPFPRVVSNRLFARKKTRSDRFTNNMLTFYGQFLTFDMANQQRDPIEAYFYSIPPCDKFRDINCECCADPFGDFGNCFFGKPHCFEFIGRNMNFAGFAAFFAPNLPITESNPRHVWNQGTHFIDLSNIYGSTYNAAFMMRQPGTPYMRVDTLDRPMAGFLLGHAVERGDKPDWFRRGEFKLNKVPPPMIIANMYLLNHNRLVDEIRASAALNGEVLDDDILYEEARRKNIAYHQDVTYREYIAALLGRPLNPYDTNKDGKAAERGLREYYDPDVQPRMDIGFSCAAYRASHTAIPIVLTRLNQFFDPSDHDDILIRDNYFNNSEILAYNESSKEIVRGLVASRQYNAEPSMVDDVRNYMMFEPAFGQDLAASNIARGRDVGLPPINVVRDYYNLPRYSSCRDIASDPEVADILEELYGEGDSCLNTIDLWVAGLCEKHVEQSSIGETFHAMTFEQFTAMRNGDRFYYENQLPQDLDETGVSFNPYPLSDAELDDVYLMNLETLFTLNFQFAPGELGAGIFFTKSRQLETLTSNGQLVVGDFTAPPEFENFMKLSPSYGIWWLVDYDDQTITFRLQTATNGWVGFGIEPDENTMKGADIYFCRKFPNGTSEISDRFALDVGPPAIDNVDLLAEGGENNVINPIVDEIDGQTTCTFTRPLDTGDVWDKQIHSGFTKVMFAYNPETDELVYHGPTRKSNVEMDMFQKTPEDEVSNGILIVMGILAALGIIYLIFVILAIIIKEEYFKFMSPLFCQLMCVGGILAFVCVFTLLRQPPTNGSCMSYPWFLGIGYMIMFGCLFAKTWRLWRLFSSRSLKATVISNGFLLKVVALVVLPMLIFLIVWTAADGIESRREWTDHDDTKVHTMCHTPIAWWIIFVCMVGSLLAIGCVLTFLIRNIPPEFNDAEAIGFSIYNATLMLAIGCAVGWGLEDYVNAVVAIQGFTVIVAIWFTGVVLFAPTLYRAFISKEEPRTFQSSMALGSGGSNVSGLTSGSSVS